MVAVCHRLTLSARLVAVLAATVFASSTSSCTRGTSPEFDEYLTRYGRDYGPDSDDYNSRVHIFHANLRFIQAHNANPNKRWTAGLNHFADRTEEELEHLHGWRHVHLDGGEGGDGTGSMFLETESEESSYEASALNASIDWTRLHMAPDIPDQGPCGSCWALATASMLEARYELANHVTGRTFSAQQLVDCVPNPRACGGTGGCKGATVELAMSYIEKRGLKTRDEVRYQAHTSRCRAPVRGSPRFGSSFLELEKHERHWDHHYEDGGISIGLRSWKKLPSNRAGPLMHAVQNGPVAISVGATPFHFYQGGVFDGCGRDSVINHAVTLFGYGQTEAGEKYWNVRNSWGPDWGESGFIRLRRGASLREDDQYCGIDHNPKVGVACKPYPKQSRVCGMCGMLFDSVAADMTNVEGVRGL